MVVYMLRMPLWLLTGLLLSCAHTKEAPNPMLGQWENLTHGGRVGLLLLNDGKCELTIERPLKKPSTRSCKYEPYNDRYLIFLMNPNGSCSFDPDFEFIFDSDAPLITLLVDQAEIFMNKTASETLHQ